MPARDRLRRLRWRLGSALGGIRGRMMVLLMVAGIPVAAIAITNALQDYRSALDDGRAGVRTLRALMAARYGVAIGGAEALLLALSRQNASLAGDAVGCTASFRRLLELHPADIADLAVVAAGQAPGCGTLPAGFDPQPLLREALASGAPAYGTFLVGGRGRASVLPVAVPGTSGGGPDGGWAVIGTIVLREDATLPGGSRTPADMVWLVDRRGRVLSPGMVNQPELAPAVAASAGQGDGTVEGPRGDIVYAGARLNPGLNLVVGHPISSVREAARAILIQRIMELATFLVACLAAIVVGADLAMVRPLRLLSARVRGWRPGNAFPVNPSGTEPREVRAVEQAFSEAAEALTRREADLRAALEQRDALMAEIHHRVKNNLQIVSSLLNLQAGRIGDPAAAAEFLAARNRVRALATLHRHLYVQHSSESVSLGPFLTELANQQFASHNEAPGERIALRLEIADIAISTDQAVTLSLFVTEAMGNAVEHAFPEDRRGTIWLSIDETAGEVTLTVRDDGIGLPDRGVRPRGLGLQLMDGFARQLGGPLKGGRMEEEPGGTMWTIRFPLRANPPPRSMAN